jgi:hypothetical protein
MMLVLVTVLVVVPPCRTGSEVCTGGGEGPPPRFKQTVPTLTTIQAGQTAYLTCEIFCVNNRSIQDNITVMFCKGSIIFLMPKFIVTNSKFHSSPSSKF